MLLVEDDADLRQSLSDLLRDAGFEVAVAENGLVALTYLEDSPPPCLVLLDLMMPVMNGWEFREAQTRNHKLSDIPVVILTADGRAELKAESLGAAGYLRKPIEVARLLGMLAEYEC
ncbi:MAG: response regulator [Acidobacteria bacterium]|nr:response regulator [Acidobacteriota bacterium]MCA1611553.1 response regulator [Acidobacteriota bacterium]